MKNLLFIFCLSLVNFGGIASEELILETSDESLERDRILVDRLTTLIQNGNGSFSRSDDDGGGFSSGGGGNGVVCFSDAGAISEVSLLDYVEGLRKDQSLETALNLEGTSVSEKIQSAFKAMRKRWPFLADSLEKRALFIEENMDRFLLPAKEGKLTPIIDMDLTFVPNENTLGHKCRIVRFAVQEKLGLSGQKKFNFVKDLYEHPKTSLSTKAGIILHEVIYEEAIKYGAKNSNFVRWFNYLISSTTFELFTEAELRDLERDEGSEFLRGRSLDYFRRGSPYNDFDTDFREYKIGEELLTRASRKVLEKSCLAVGLCSVDKGVLKEESASSTDFSKKYVVENSETSSSEYHVSDIAKTSVGLCHPDGGCIGAKVKVQKFSSLGRVSYEGVIVGVFGEGDFAVKVLSSSLKLSHQLKPLKDGLISNEELVLFARRSTTSY